MSGEDGRAKFVMERFAAGWTRGQVKAGLRKQFGSQPTAELERLLRDAMDALAVAVETDAGLARALDLYRRWTAIHNLANAQLIARERLHRSLKIPPPAEMLGLERDWGTNAPPPLEALLEIEGLLANLKAVLAPRATSLSN